MVSQSPQRHDGRQPNRRRWMSRQRRDSRTTAGARERERSGVSHVHVLVVVPRQQIDDGLEGRCMFDAAERFGSEEAHACVLVLQ